MGVKPAELWDYAWAYYQDRTGSLHPLLLMTDVDHPRAFDVLKRQLESVKRMKGAGNDYALVFIGLREICDSRAIGLLKALADSGDDEIRTRASDALAWYRTRTVPVCQARSRAIARR
ncbi:MAG: hypothetical protein R3E65_03635 [Steroidobacteraceae bacterium]